MNEEIPSAPLDEHFARLMLRLNGKDDPALAVAARTVSAWRAAGHICVPLEKLAGVTAEKLRATRVVGEPGAFRPLILDHRGRLYLQRYWSYEAQLATAIGARLIEPARFDEELLAKGLQRLFGKSGKQTNWQRIAVETALRKNFSVITGGPGTGKTWTVVAVLALLHEQFAAAGATLRMALAAPTGKAAARMRESIQQTVESDPKFAAYREALDQDAMTLHRLLGVVPESPYFRHDAGRPLAVDVAIVDEASMVDLALMAKLFAAVPPGARLVLLGDKDQLSSVEAGNVLGDLCNSSGGANVAAPIAEHIVQLQRNFRFRETSGIKAFSLLVNSGEAEAAAALLHAGAHADLAFSDTPAPAALESQIKPRVLAGYSAFLNAGDPREALKALGRFRILCATRRGPYGVENLSRLAERTLAASGKIAPDATFYHGRPVLVLTNDYQLGLFNGDVGLILRDPEAEGELRAFFTDTAGVLRRILPMRLPEHETTFAMTVHKSQGSEFQNLLLVLPDRDSPVVTRELVYTGITRAREAVELWADEAVLVAAVRRRTQRSSGLREALWGGSGAAAL